ncbi:MAG: NUDIX domain-containing protein [Anaerolineales bacterium]|jgi:8-oxo-dGTP diphosphatase
MGREEQGVRGRERYALIPRTLVFLFCGDQVLLLQGAPTKKIWPSRYNGIGGHLERGESLLEAARRELREEAGLEPVDLSLCGLITVDVESDQGVLVAVFRGELPSCLAPQPSAEGTAEWVPVREARRLPVVPDLEQLLPRISGWKPEAPVFHAHSYYDEHETLRVHISP